MPLLRWLGVLFPHHPVAPPLGIHSLACRYGLAYIGNLLGYAENYYRRLLNSQRTKKLPKKLKALLSKGFTAYQITVRVPREGSGSKVAHTITLAYEGREFEVVVIDPNGLGPGQPSVGFGYRMAERYAGVPESTVRGWVRESDGGKSLELPSGKGFRVRDIAASDGNTYSVVEASDWFSILSSPPKTT